MAEAFQQILPVGDGSIVALCDGNYILAGSSHSFSRQGLTDIWLLKINSAGDSLDSRVLSIPGEQGVAGRSGIIELEDGSLVVTGWSGTMGENGDISDSDVLLVKTTPTGFGPPETPDIAVSPASLDFNEVFLGENAEQSLTISNEGNAILHISGITLDDPPLNLDGGNGFDLEPGASVELVVTFTPEERGEYTGEIIIASDDPVEQEIEIDLAGSGLWVPSEELLGRQIEQIDELVHAHVLNRGQGNGLTAKLDGAIEKLDRGQVRPALNRLNAFINQVESLIEEDVLTEEQGQPLIDETHFIIALLQEFGVAGLSNLALQVPVVIPSQYYLNGGFPNPFNSSTVFKYGLPEASPVSLKVYDTRGRLVASPVDGKR